MSWCALNDSGLCALALVFGLVMLFLLLLVLYVGYLAWKDPGFFSLARGPAVPRVSTVRRVKGRARRG